MTSVKRETFSGYDKLFEVDNKPNLVAGASAIYDDRVPSRTWFEDPNEPVYKAWKDGHFSWTFSSRHLRFRGKFLVGRGFTCSTKLSCCSEPIPEKPSFNFDMDSFDFESMFGNPPLQFRPVPVNLTMYSTEKVSAVADNFELVGRQK
jgi:hypothetical protein